MQVRIDVEIEGSHEGFKETAKDEPKQAGKLIEPELRAFDNYMMRNGMDPLGRVESQIVREYIGFKLASAETQHEV